MDSAAFLVKVLELSAPSLAPEPAPAPALAPAPSPAPEPAPEPAPATATAYMTVTADTMYEVVVMQGHGPVKTCRWVMTDRKMSVRRDQFLEYTTAE